MTRLRLALAVGALAFAATEATAAEMATGWEALTISQEQCVAIAAQAAQQTGFGQDITRQPTGIYGWRGNDTVSVRCIAERRIAVFFAYTRDSNTALAAVDALRPFFSGRAPGAPGAPAAK